MNKNSKLVERYERQLEKIIKEYSGDVRKDRYIDFAKQELEAVKNGRTW